MGDLKLADILLAGQYKVCARNHQGLIEAIRKEKNR
jgi:hypothetical protein